MIRWFHMVLVALVFTASMACSKPDVDMTRISLGMEKQDVIKKLGKPTHVSAQGNLEIFEYEAYDKRPILGAGYKKENFRYTFVRFLSGKVESYGNKGDFDSAKPFVKESKVELTVKQ